MTLSADQIIALIRGEKIPYMRSLPGSVIQMESNESTDPDSLCDIAEAAYDRCSQIENDESEEDD